MALLYALVGAISGEKGHLFLQCAECFLEQVQIRTMRDQQQPSRDWSRVHLAVLNNQACISNELCMHARAEGQLTEMNLRLQRASDVLDGEVLKQFSLNFQCMQRGKLAGAA